MRQEEQGMRHPSPLLRLPRHALGWISAGSYQCVTFHQAFECIQLEKCHCRAAYVGQADDVNAIELKVIRPLLGPRIKQRHEVACFGIDGADVAPLPAIANRARQCQVVEQRLTPVLFGDRMIHLVGGSSEFLVEQTVFTAVTRPLDHLTSQLRRGSGGHVPSF
jgi:hypothetical protein